MTDREKLNALLNKQRRFSTSLNWMGYINAYKKKNVKGLKKVKGKYVEWDSSKNAPYDAKVAEKQIYKDFFGTETPKADIEYLKAKIVYDSKFNKDGTPKLDPISERFSRKLADGGTVYGDEVKTKLANEKANLNKLAEKSSYRAGIIDQAEAALKINKNNKGNEGKTVPSSEAAITKATEEVVETGSSEGGDAILDAVVAEGGKAAINLSDYEKYSKQTNKIYNEFIIPEKRLDLSIKEKPPKLKSDVFTLDAEGNRLGVMTNRQRLKWESLEENQALMRSRREGTDPITGKSKLKIADRTYSSGLVGAG